MHPCGELYESLLPIYRALERGLQRNVLSEFDRIWNHVSEFNKGSNAGVAMQQEAQDIYNDIQGR